MRYVYIVEVGQPDDVKVKDDFHFAKREDAESCARFFKMLEKDGKELIVNTFIDELYDDYFQWSDMFKKSIKNAHGVDKKPKWLTKAKAVIYKLG